MPASQSLPPHALRLTTYAELQRYARAFADGHLNLLLLFGHPGVGKSRCLRQALTGPVGWLGGQATAFGIYCEVYQHRHQPLVFDDIDGLHTDRTAIRLLKALCQTEPRKSLCWLTDAATLDRRNIPRRFTTTSRVALIGNQWRTLNADVAALEDRGHLLVFEPGAVEVHRQAAEWFWDQEIFDLVADHLHLLMPPSLRTYWHAWELKCAGLDWRRGVLSRCLSGPALEVAQLKADPSFASEAARVRAFVQSGAGCRATYFRYAKRLQPAVAPPPLRLAQTAPPAESRLDADHLDTLRRRFGELGRG
jgi:hypothetical protein